MRALTEIVLFTPELDRLRQFYEQRLGLETRDRDPGWVSFATGGATLALRPQTGIHEREIEITFASDDVEADARRLKERGIEIPGGVQRPAYGPVAHLRDPDGNAVALRQAGSARPAEGSPAIDTVIVNVRDREASLAFYRDRLGLRVLDERPHWVELEAGATRLALHTRAPEDDQPLHAASNVAWCFEVADVPGEADRLRERGLTLASAPVHEDFGLYAEVLDPDGNVIVLREQADDADRDAAAEAWDDLDEGATHPVGIRKPPARGSKAVGRALLATLERPIGAPRSPAGGRGARPARVAQAAKPGARRAASTRGAGPDRARRGPKTVSDVKRAKAKPAVGRKKKAEVVRATEHKVAIAQASRGRPVKRAAAQRATTRTRAGSAAGGARATTRARIASRGRR